MSETKSASDYKVGDISALLGSTHDSSKSEELFGTKAEPSKPQETISNKKRVRTEDEEDKDEVKKVEPQKKKAKFSKEEIDAKRIAKKTTDSSRKLFVANVPIFDDNLKKVQKAVKKLFTPFGKVQNVFLRNLAVKEYKVQNRKIALMQGMLDKDRKPFGTAYITFAEDQGDKDLKDILASAIKELNGTKFEGRHLTVDYVQNADGTTTDHKIVSSEDHKRSIFLGNLPFDVDDEEVWNLFEQKAGLKVCGVRVIRDMQTQKGKGFGYVLLEDEAAVRLATNKNEHFSIRENLIRIKKSNPNATKVKEAKQKRKEDKEEKRQSQKQRSKESSTRKIANAIIRKSGEENPYAGLQSDKKDFLDRVVKERKLKRKIREQSKTKGKKAAKKNLAAKNS